MSMSRNEPTLFTDAALRALDKHQHQEVLCANLANTRSEIIDIRNNLLLTHAAVSWLIAFTASYRVLGLRARDPIMVSGVTVAAITLSSAVFSHENSRKIMSVTNHNTDAVVLSNYVTETMFGIGMAGIVWLTRHIIPYKWGSTATRTPVAAFVAGSAVVSVAGAWWTYNLDKKLRMASMTVPPYYAEVKV